MSRGARQSDANQHIADEQNIWLLAVSTLGGAAGLYWTERFRSMVTEVVGNDHSKLAEATVWLGMHVMAASVGFVATFLSTVLAIVLRSVAARAIKRSANSVGNN